MVLTRHTLRLTVDNDLNGLCDVFDENAGPKVMVKQMIHMMYLIASVHKFLLQNVEQVQKKQKKVYVVCKGLQTFDGLEENNKVKMRRLGKKRSLINN
jgi:hypothetical protein